MDSQHERLDALTRSRWRIALALTSVMVAIYFGFMLLIAYGKTWLGNEIVPGLSWGILLGALVILLAWLLIFIYVRWANLHYDRNVKTYRDAHNETNREPAS